MGVSGAEILLLFMIMATVRKRERERDRERQRKAKLVCMILGVKKTMECFQFAVRFWLALFLS